MRTALLLLLVATVAAAFAWQRWHSFVDRDPFLPPAHPRPDPADRNHGDPIPASVARQLDRPLPPGTRLEGRLQDAIDTLRDNTGMNVFVNWQSLEPAGVGRDTHVAVHVGGVTTSEALTRLLAAASPKNGRRLDALDFDIDDGVVTIATKQDLSFNTLTRVYDVRDLVAATPPPAPVAGGAPPSWRAPVPARTDLAKLARLTGKIQAIEPETWRDAGGHAGSVRELGGQLIVTQTPWVQRVITCTLARERWWLRWRAFGVRAAPTVIIPVALVATLRWVPWLRRRRARRAGRCETCGYDLGRDAGPVSRMRRRRPKPGAAGRGTGGGVGRMAESNRLFSDRL